MTTLLEAHADDPIDLLRCELRLTKQTHMAVVQRLQRRIDELEAKLATSEKYERQANRQIDNFHAAERYHVDNLADACGGYGGERI